MKIVTVMEDTKGDKDCYFEHGLSVYLETKEHRILMDTGATDHTIKNAEKLGINLSKIDTVILSHGHYDHAGGVLAFADINTNAKIYMQKKATENYVHGDRYIGIDPEIKKLPQVIEVEGNLKIDEELSLFSGVTGRRYWPASNLGLCKKIEIEQQIDEGVEQKERIELVQDVFDHEQYLVMKASGSTFLISGCAHNGILNILDKYKELYGSLPDVVISGFHMMKKTEYSEDEILVIKATAKELASYNIKYFTGHCTGEKAFIIMKQIMGEKLLHIHSGCEILF